MNSIAFYRATFFSFLHAPLCRTGTKSVRQFSLPKIRSDHGQHRRVSTNRGLFFSSYDEGHRQRGCSKKNWCAGAQAFCLWSNFNQISGIQTGGLRMLRGVISGNVKARMLYCYTIWIFMDFCCNEFSLACPSWLATPARSCNFFVSLKSRKR